MLGHGYFQPALNARFHPAMQSRSTQGLFWFLMPYRFNSEYPVKFLRNITLSFLLACRAPVCTARTNTDNTGARAIGEYTDIHLDCAGG
jgi:hypothetical protein